LKWEKIHSIAAPKKYWSALLLSCKQIYSRDWL
jgi:hypothetical protein